MENYGEHWTSGRQTAEGILPFAMGVVICMLRAVNVGGHNLIPMEALRRLCEAMGLRDARTYVQSGNVVFRTKEWNLVRLANRIQKGIERKFGFSPGVVLRTPAELKRGIAKNPFAGRPGIEPGKLLVTFLASDPGAEARRKVLEIQADPEEVHMHGRELYIYYPNGIGRSKLSGAVLEKTLGTPGTARNWNSVTKLLEMAEELEGGE
jgi:uncharacterized protein (DUF1697 family)